MIEFLTLVLHSAGSRFKSRARIEAENLVLRHQLNVLRRKASKRAWLTNANRLLFVWLHRVLPSVLDAITIIKPETVIRWHRRGFRSYWRWKSRARSGRPRVAAEIRDLAWQMSLANPLRGAPRIHGELLKVGIEVVQVEGRAIHGQRSAIAVAELEDVSAESCCQYCSSRPVRGPDRFLQLAPPFRHSIAHRRRRLSEQRHICFAVGRYGSGACPDKPRPPHRLRLLRMQRYW